MDVKARDNRETLAKCCRDFSQLLLAWENPSLGRNLPWVFESDPYKVWVSEIMLQQTQAATVVPYYSQFINRFPDVISLANATLDEVLQLWTGLGYYSRARNLHTAAGLIRDNYSGQIPQDFASILALPGIGQSTAGAICALAFGMSTPILDGNAKRVYARYFCVDDEKDSQRTRKLWQIARACTPEKECQKYTQLIMDLGATVCSPKRPNCDNCPLVGECCAKLNSLTSKLPLSKRSVNRKTKTVMLILATDSQGRLLIERRPATGIWGGLWSFPEFHNESGSVEQWFRQQYSIDIETIEYWQEFTHHFTHYRLQITPVLVRIMGIASNPTNCPDIDFVSPCEPMTRGVPAPVAELMKAFTQRSSNPR